MHQGRMTFCIYLFSILNIRVKCNIFLLQKKASGGGKGGDKGGGGKGGGEKGGKKGTSL